MKSSLKLGLLAAALALAGTACATDYDLVPLWESYNAVVNDSFYSTDYTQYRSTIPTASGGLGVPGNPNNEAHGVAAWLPCSNPNLLGPHNEAPNPSTINPDMGYSDVGIPMNFTCAQPAGALPLYRFYKGSPVTDHFYTTNATDIATAYSNGFTFERVEGYLFTTQVSGSLPLYRLSKCFSVTGGQCDLEHRYTLGDNAKSALMAGGWTYDGIAGYAFPRYVNANATGVFTGTVNGMSGNGSTPTSVQLRNLAPPKTATTLKAQSRNNLYGQWEVNATVRPANATKQQLSFTFNTGNLFDPGTNMSHIPFFVHADAQIGSDAIGAVPYQGLGIFFSRDNVDGCAAGPAGGQIFVQLFGKIPGPDIDCNSKMKNASGTVVTLAANHNYQVDVTVTDAAVLSYVVKDKDAAGTPTVATFLHDYSGWYTCPLNSDTGTLTVSTAYCANPYVGVKFPLKSTGYYVVPAALTTSASTYAGSFSNMYLRWLDAAGNVLSQM